jgi:hypothetical protein
VSLLGFYILHALLALDRQLSLHPTLRPKRSLRLGCHGQALRSVWLQYLSQPPDAVFDHELPVQFKEEYKGM